MRLAAGWGTSELRAACCRLEAGKPGWRCRWHSPQLWAQRALYLSPAPCRPAAQRPVGLQPSLPPALAVPHACGACVPLWRRPRWKDWGAVPGALLQHLCGHRRPLPAAPARPGHGARELLRGGFGGVAVCWVCACLHYGCVPACVFCLAAHASVAGTFSPFSTNHAPNTQSVSAFFY